MRNLQNYITIGIVFIIGSLGCAPTVTMKMLVPPQYDPGSIKKIGILDFSVQRSNRISFSFFSRENVGKIMSDQLAYKFVQNGYFTVVDRYELYRVLVHYGLSLIGVISQDDLKKAKQALQVDGFVTGNIFYSVKDETEVVHTQSTVTDTSGVTKMVSDTLYKARRLVDVTFGFKLIDATDGSIHAAFELTKNNYNRNNSVFDNCKDTVIRKSSSEALNRLPNVEDIIQEMIDGVCYEMVLMVAPHYAYRSRSIATGKSLPMKNGAAYVKKSLWEDAIREWQVVILDNSIPPKERAGAASNIGVYYEVKGDLHKADSLYNEAFKISGDDRYLDSREAIRSRMRELERLKMSN